MPLRHEFLNGHAWRTRALPLAEGKAVVALHGIAATPSTGLDRATSKELFMETADFPSCFTIDHAKILDLFTGETFYSSIDASIREAVLNAIDAVGRRREKDTSLIQQIDACFDRQSQTITVCDNGDGMGRKEVSKLFSKIGASAAQIAADAQRGEYKAVGEFGIGVLSYFLVCERFQIHSTKADGESLGLEFTRDMLDAETRAKLVEPQRQIQGTKLILYIEKESSFSTVLERFPHWIRDVEGLTATEIPGDHRIEQGGIGRQVKPVVKKIPDWIHLAHVGPPVLFDSWDHFDGSAHVDILYRGVFVSSVAVDRLWAIEGAIHVDPKHFRPKLNREGFVGNQLQSELEPVLRSYHPPVLERAIECVREMLSDEVTQKWSLRRWVTLWLAVPRSGPYQEAARLWDEEFRTRNAFRLLGPGQQIEEVSIRDLEELGREELYIAPRNLPKVSHIVQQAVRVLRNSDQPVVQGVDREPQFLKTTSLVGSSTGDLLVNHFKDTLPKLTNVESVAESVVRRDAVATMFDEPPKVQLVKLGVHSAAIIPVRQEIWINIEHDGGKEIVRTVCSRNEGHVGLWIGCIEHGKEYAKQLASLLADRPSRPERLGPIRRQFLTRTLDIVELHLKLTQVLHLKVTHLEEPEYGSSVLGVSSFCLLGFLRRAVFEAVAIVAGFNDVAVMSQPVE